MRPWMRPTSCRLDLPASQPAKLPLALRGARESAAAQDLPSLTLYGSIVSKCFAASLSSSAEQVLREKLYIIATIQTLLLTYGFDGSILSTDAFHGSSRPKPPGLVRAVRGSLVTA